MALIKCPKCGREISDKSVNCIGCGWKVEVIKDAAKEQTTKLQNTVEMKRDKRVPNTNILFTVALTFIMLCFMIVVWRRLDKFETEIDMMASSYQLESEMITNDIENENVEDLEDNNTKEEISDNDSQNENLIGENGQQEETPENIVSSEEDVVSADNSNLKFEYTGNKVSSSYVKIYFKITNEGDVPIYLTIQRYHLLNDVSIERAFSVLDNEILPEKSALLDISFSREKVEAAEISTIDSFVCQYNIAEDADNKNLTPNEITFNGLGININ